MADNEDEIQVMVDKEDEAMVVDSETKPAAAKKTRKKAGPKSKTQAVVTIAEDNVENADDSMAETPPAKKPPKKMGPKSKTMVNEVETFKIAIKNVAKGVETGTIRNEFEKFGKIGRFYKNVTLTDDGNQTFTVIFESLEEAQDAIMEMDGKEFQGQALGVEMVLEVVDQVGAEDAVDKKENGDKSKSYFYSNTSGEKSENGSKRGKKRGQGELHGSGGPPYYCYNPACEHVQQFGECVRYKTPCKLADSGPPIRGRNRGGGGGPVSKRGGGQGEVHGSGGPPYYCYSPDCEHVQQFGECVRYKTPCKHADSGPPIRGRNRGGGGPASTRGGHTRDLRNILPPRVAPYPSERPHFGPPSRGRPFGPDFGLPTRGRPVIEDYGPPPPPRIGPIGLDYGPPPFGGGGPFGEDFGAPLRRPPRREQFEPDYEPLPRERPLRQNFGPPSRGGPFRRDFDLGPPSMREPPMYEEPSNASGPPFEPNSAGDGPPFLCFNPACPHVQQNGECVRYKSPCPNSNGGPPRGRGRGRGNGRGLNRGQARGKTFSGRPAAQDFF